MIGICIPAGGVPKETVARCLLSIRDSRPTVPYCIEVDLDGSQPFSRGACRNRAILKLIPTCDKAVCIDVDMLVPPGLIDHAERSISDGQAFIAHCHYLRSFDGQYHWGLWKQGNTAGIGGFIGATTSDWCYAGGWDERVTDWGCEDDLLLSQFVQRGIGVSVDTSWPLVHIGHSSYSPRNPRRANRNFLNLVRSGFVNNNLCGKMPVAPFEHTLYLWVTAACSGACRTCSQKPLIELDPGYQMSPQGVLEVVEAAKASGYAPFSHVCIVGGDCTLWRHLNRGTAILHRADIGPIRLFTNAVAGDNITRQIARRCGSIAVSKYGWNGGHISRLKSRFPRKVVIWDTPNHWIPPSGPLDGDVSPPDCIGPGYLVYKSHVYPCCNLPATGLWHGMRLEDIPRTPLRKGFVESLMAKRADLGSLCRGCIGNRKVQPLLATREVNAP